MNKIKSFQISQAILTKRHMHIVMEVTVHMKNGWLGYYCYKLDCGHIIKEQPKIYIDPKSYTFHAKVCPECETMDENLGVLYGPGIDLTPIDKKIRLGQYLKYLDNCIDHDTGELYE